MGTSRRLPRASSAWVQPASLATLEEQLARMASRLDSLEQRMAAVPPPAAQGLPRVLWADLSAGDDGGDDNSVGDGFGEHGGWGEATDSFDGAVPTPGCATLECEHTAAGTSDSRASCTTNGLAPAVKVVYDCEMDKATTHEKNCLEIKTCSEGDMKGFLGYCEEPLVSTDFETKPISCTFDSQAGIKFGPMGDASSAENGGVTPATPALGAAVASADGYAMDGVAKHTTNSDSCVVASRPVLNVIGLIGGSAVGGSVADEAADSMSTRVTPAAPASSAAVASAVGYTIEEVAKHITKSDCCVVASGQVLKVANSLLEHPSGERALLAFADKDATEDSNMIHPPDAFPNYASEAVIGMIGGSAVGGSMAEAAADSINKSVTPAAPASGAAVARADGYAKDEVAKHTTKSDCCVVASGQALSVTNSVSEHPGVCTSYFCGQRRDKTCQHDSSTRGIRGRTSSNTARSNGAHSKGYPSRVCTQRTAAQIVDVPGRLQENAIPVPTTTQHNGREQVVEVTGLIKYPELTQAEFTRLYHHCHTFVHSQAEARFTKLLESLEQEKELLLARKRGGEVTAA